MRHPLLGTPTRGRIASARARGRGQGREGPRGRRRSATEDLRPGREADDRGSGSIRRNAMTSVRRRIPRSGSLRQVIVHRPGLELRRLTPAQLRRAALRRRPLGQAGPRGARRLRRRAARSGRRGPPLRRAAGRDARRCRRPAPGVLDRRLHRPTTSAPASSTRCGTSSTIADPDDLATHLIGGITVARARPPAGARACVAARSTDDDFVLAPAAQPPLPPRHLLLGLRRRVDQPDGEAGPPAGDRSTSRRSTASTRCSPTPASATWYGGDDDDHGRPRSRAATSS